MIACDLCIVGAGAAGITIALELIEAGLDVLVLESGGLEFDPAVQALARGRSIGAASDALDAARLRFFGGSTNHWGGFCRPFDPVDFAVRPWVPDSGWPIERADLDPFYTRAAAMLDLADDDFSVARWRDALPPLFGGPLFEGRLEPVVYQLSPPTRMGEKYRGALERARDVRVMLHANLLRIGLHPGRRRVMRLDVGTLEGGRFGVTPAAVVLATGGIENARLLLASRDVERNGVGNGHDLVGRYFMDHPSHHAATLLLNAPSDDARRPLMRPVFPYATLREDVAREEGLLRFMTTMHVGDELFDEPQGYVALREIGRAILRREWPADLTGRLASLAADLDGAAEHGFRRFFGRSGTLHLRIHPEVAPNRESRVTLGDETDALGMPRPVLDWRLGELDRHTIRRGLSIVGAEAGRTGIGRLRIEPWMLEDPFAVPGIGSWHHVGTTRMHDDPRCGVVDREGRVHGLDNLFVAGSSVFPTEGFANPTLTIVALALRLADHLDTTTG